MEKPRQGFWGLWNTSFGFFGIQIGFALQNANVSRIFQSLGTAEKDLAFLWIAAPLTGLLVQPVIGHYSDRTWGRFGRRRPYFLAGAVLATLALVGMPNAGGLIGAALLLWLLDASLNISMEPFRAFVGDMLPSRQRTAGYAFQTGFIGAGAVLGSLAPMVLTDVFHVANVAGPGEVPPSVRYGFYIGAAALFTAVLWTVLTTREYAPEQLARFAESDERQAAHSDAVPASGIRTAPLWIVAGLLIVAAVKWFALDKPVYLLGGGVSAFGLAQIVSAMLVRAGKGQNALSQILADLSAMPSTMKRLALVQFFTWSALFIMWIYTTPIVAERVFHTTDANSAAFNAGANWVGVLFAVYSGVATLWAFALPPLARAIGRRNTHVLGCFAGRRVCVVPGDPRRVGADGRDGAGRHRLGLDPDHALCNPVGGAAGRKAGHLHGLVQYLYRVAAADRVVDHGGGGGSLLSARHRVDDGHRGGRDGLAALAMLRVARDA